MSVLLLEGKTAAQALLESLRSKVQELNPKLVVVQVGKNEASASYIRQKIKSCDDVGMRHEHLQLEDSCSFEELLQLIHRLNADADTTGFIIQLPLPPHLQPRVPEVIRAIDPKKDVDGFGAYNLGKMFLSTEFEHLPPATPSGVISLLEHYRIPVESKHIVVVGHSNIVGKPLAVMLCNRNATVTICHKFTKDLPYFTKQADILCVAVGKPGLITKEMVKQGVVVIDIGITRVGDKLVGDTDFEALKDIASAITPVPGGVGPMTVASLIRNCVRAKERQVECK